MTTGQVESSSSLIADLPTAAAREAAANFAANAQSLARSQPRLFESLSADLPPLEWVFGRDGALTARIADRWQIGCSIPRRASQAILKALDPQGAIACLVSPSHAQQIDGMLARMRADQGLIVIAPDVADLKIHLHCCDFSAAISAGRLWFAWAERWEEELARLFAENPGLSLPQQLTRTILLEQQQMEAMAAAAKRVFADETARRATRVRQLSAQWKPTRTTPARLAVISPSLFRLWDDAGAVLADTLARRTAFQAVSASDRLEACPTGAIHRFDPDHPATASSLLLAETVAHCDALLAADLCRADLPAVLPDRLPLLTWITTPRIGRYDGAHPADGLLLAGPSFQAIALATGWPPGRIALAGWPGDPGLRIADCGLRADVAANPQSAIPNPQSPRPLAILADTIPIAQPTDGFPYSSHRLLWELIEHELRKDPFILTAAVGEFIESRMRRLSIGPEGLDRRLFVERLILPAYQQGLARALVKAGLPVQLFGQGWSDIPGLAPHAQGPIRSRQHLLDAARAAGALVHVWPARHAHPIDALGRPVVRRSGQADAFIRAARSALSDVPPTSDAIPPLSLDAIAQLLDQP